MQCGEGDVVLPLFFVRSASATTWSARDEPMAASKVNRSDVRSGQGTSAGRKVRRG
jgi:hypothetical protein